MHNETTNSAAIAKAIRDTLVSPNCADAHLEPANVVDGLYSLAAAIHAGAKHLGHADAATPMGAIEALGQCILESSERVAASLNGVAQAIRDASDATMRHNVSRSEENQE